MNGLLTVSATELRAQLDRLDDPAQRVMVQELIIQNHVALADHLKEHMVTMTETMKKVDAMHTALFECSMDGTRPSIVKALYDPDNGLYYLRKWISRSFTVATTVIISVIGIVGGIAALGRNYFGWW